MVDWVSFFLYSIQKVVSTLFSLDTGVGFSLGDLQLSLLIIGLVASALVIRSGSAAQDAAMFGNARDSSILRRDRLRRLNERRHK